MPFCPPAARPPRSKLYRPRHAPSTPLYRLLQDHLETFLAGFRPTDASAHPILVERALRAYLECGVHRFGMVRFRCVDCGESLFVAFSCKRRLTCPSCDGKRAAMTASHAMDELLPDVPYRQWVLVVPKRVRYFLHQMPGLAGELCALLAQEIGRHFARKLGEGAPAEMHFVQRYGSSVNLHLHIHAVVSDGLFQSVDGRLEFVPAPPLSEEETAAIVESIRRKVLRRFARRGLIPREAAQEMLAWENSGFSIHASTTTPAGDREALERLLHYCARPALSVKRLEYRKKEGVAVYDARDKQVGKRTLIFTPLEFIGRLARLVPPPRRNLVRYYGALAPNSPLRPLVCAAAAAASRKDPMEAVGRAVGKVVGAVSRTWAKCLSRIFEVDALLCPACGGRMAPVAAIVSDRELVRVLTYLGLPTGFPVLAPSRSPPAGDEESQAAPAGLYDGVDGVPPDDEYQASPED